ncbi:hypothetical protein [Streptomyces sp. HD]|uniref:hypothetical protein n=1 Tax=Streptomyces sp. HD TaxID=3020892 RepID=UPI00232AD686|nr:hypothetical protein [Streptomyces sp. HD]MDC0772880.1 hypothetical protein [Streptomyces sp. HD]
MRGITRRTGAAGLAAVAMVAGLTACTGGTDDRVEACTDGTYAWSGVKRWEKLTELADPIFFEKKTASYSSKLKRVDNTVYRPGVSVTPKGVGAAAVIKALGRHLKVEEPLAGPSETYGEEVEQYFENATGDLKGAYYAWGYLKLVDADFTYTCGSGTPLKGHVRTWEGSGSAFLPCSSEPWHTTTGREAAVRTCPEGSTATKNA